MNKQIKVHRKILVMSLFSFLFLVLMIVINLVGSLNWTVFKAGKKLSELKVPIEHVGWIVVFYFTFQSNFFVFIYLLLRGVGLLKPKSKLKDKIFQLVVIVNITITMIVYWIVLAPFSSIWTHKGVAGVLQRTNTIMIHFITPVFMFITYHIDRLQKGEQGIILTKKHIGYILIYPIMWLIIAIIVYYATRTENHYSVQKLANGDIQLVKDINGSVVRTSGVAIYFFLNFDELALYIPILISLTITLAFFVFGFLFIALSNPESKIYSIKIKRKK